MSTHRDDNWTLTVANTPTEIKIATKGTSNLCQRKDMYQAIRFKTSIPKNTKETPEQPEKAAHRTNPDNKKKQKAPKPKPLIKTPQDKRDNLATKLEDTPTMATQPPTNSQAGDSATREDSKK